MVTFGFGVYSHPRPAGLSAAIHLSFIISEMPQDYENYFRLSLGKTAFKDTTREPSFQQELTAACRCSRGWSYEAPTMRSGHFLLRVPCERSGRR